MVRLLLWWWEEGMKVERGKGSWWSRLVLWDEKVTERLHAPSGHALRWLVVVGAHLGDGPLWVAFWLFGLIYWRAVAPLRVGFILWLASAVMAAVVTYSLKFVVRRSRPRQVKGFYLQHYDKHAFPSGHATRMGTVMVWGPILFPQWGILFWVISLWCGISRAALGIHYVGDIAAGLLVGIGVSGMVWFMVTIAGLWPL